MQTLGSLVDQLNVVNLKMWNAQENLYEVRRMTFEEFKEKFQQGEGFEKLYNYFKKACDLNIQRNNIIDEIDQFIVNLLQKVKNGDINLDEYQQKKHKTY